MPHGSLGNAGMDASDGQVGAEGGAQGVDVDDAEAFKSSASMHLTQQSIETLTDFSSCDSQFQNCQDFAQAITELKM